MKKHQVIFASIVDGFHLRYLVESNVIQLIANGRNIKLVIFTSPELIERLKIKLSNYENIEYKTLQPVYINTYRKVYLWLVQITNKKLTTTLNIKNEQNRKSIKYKISGATGKILKSTRLASPICKFFSASFRSDYYGKEIEKYSPNLVISSTPGQKILDLPLLCEAIARGIPTISPVYSWDNLTAKGPLFFAPDKLCVWNKIMAKEAETFHGYLRKNIFITGVPTYDIFHGALNREHKKETFLQSKGFDTSQPLITITTIPQIYYGSAHVELVNIICNAIKTKMLPRCNVLVRPHPLDDTDYEELLKHDYVFVDKDGTKPTSDISKWIPEDNNMSYLADTLRYSDVVINIASTITIDAAIFDTPIINVNFDIRNTAKSYKNSVQRYYKYTHYQHVVSTQAASLANDETQLIQEIEQYLKNPATRRKERGELVKQQTCGFLGYSAEETANSILSLLGSHQLKP